MSEPNPTAADFKRGKEAVEAAGKVRAAAPSKSEVASLPGVSIHDNPDGTWTARVSGEKGMRAAAEAFRPQMRLSTERGYEVAARDGRYFEPKMKVRGTRYKIGPDGEVLRLERGVWVKDKE